MIFFLEEKTDILCNYYKTSIMNQEIAKKKSICLHHEQQKTLKDQSDLKKILKCVSELNVIFNIKKFLKWAWSQLVQTAIGTFIL